MLVITHLSDCAKSIKIICFGIIYLSQPMTYTTYTTAVGLACRSIGLHMGDRPLSAAVSVFGRLSLSVSSVPLRVSLGGNFSFS